VPLSKGGEQFALSNLATLVAEATAREIGPVSLIEALQLTALFARNDRAAPGCEVRRRRLTSQRSTSGLDPPDRAVARRRAVDGDVQGSASADD